MLMVIKTKEKEEKKSNVPAGYELRGFVRLLPCYGECYGNLIKFLNLLVAS